MHGQGTYTAAVGGWSLTGAFAHDRPTAGELTEADGRRYAVQYAHDCAVIQNNPAPSSKVCACVQRGRPPAFEHGGWVARAARVRTPEL